MIVAIERARAYIPNSSGRSILAIIIVKINHPNLRINKETKLYAEPSKANLDRFCEEISFFCINI